MIQALYWRYAVWTVVSSSLLRLILPLLPFHLSSRDFLYSSKRTSFRCFSPYQQMCFIPWCVGRMWHRRFSLLSSRRETQLLTEQNIRQLDRAAETTDVHSELIPQYDSLFQGKPSLQLPVLMVWETQRELPVFLHIWESFNTSADWLINSHRPPQALQQAGQKMAMFHGHMVH